MLVGTVQTSLDKLLLTQVSEGNDQAFDTLYEKYWHHVFDEAYKRTADEDQAKDIAQEVFTAMWIRCNQSHIENLPAWLYTVTKNQVYKLLQKQQKYVPIPDLLSELEAYSDRADAAILEKELLLAYYSVIASLPCQQQKIFKMRYQENRTPDEIAEKLNLSPKTIRNHLGRALVKLKATLMLVHILFVLSINNP